MISFSLSLVALVLGYLLYGRFIERIIAPDDRVTPAVAKADGLDYIVLPNWKVFMIQFLNIAGTGPIFGAIMGAKFGPVAYLWIVLGCIFAGAVHDYFVGMLSMRNEGAGLPTLIGKYLGNTPKAVMLVFTVLLLIMVGTVFVYSPAEILHTMSGDTEMWALIIFCYYIFATMLPIDKIIGKIYPLFAVSLLFMAAALMVWLFLHWPTIPELWNGMYNFGAATEPDTWKDNIFPALFITVACGAISGFHHRSLWRYLRIPRHTEPIDGPLCEEREDGASYFLRFHDYRRHCCSHLGFRCLMVLLWRALSRLSADRSGYGRLSHLSTRCCQSGM